MNKPWQPMRVSGFTLLELTIALLLLALMSAVLYGSLSLSADSWDRGQAKAEQTSEMRLTEEFLRKALGAQHPLRLHKVVEQPLLFAGGGETLAFAAALPGRAGGGLYYFRVALTADGEKSRLTLTRVVPDYDAKAPPDFAQAETSVLADGISELKLGYFGRDRDAADMVAPTWRDRWDDAQRLPDLISVDVKPAKGPAWPTLIVEPRLAPEVGCRAWDPIRRRCMGI